MKFLLSFALCFLFISSTFAQDDQSYHKGGWHHFRHRDFKDSPCFQNSNASQDEQWYKDRLEWHKKRIEMLEAAQKEREQNT